MVRRARSNGIARQARSPFPTCSLQTTPALIEGERRMSAVDISDEGPEVPALVSNMVPARRPQPTADFGQPAERGTQRVHLMLHRHKGRLLKSTSFHLRTVDGLNFASAQKCYQKKHASYKLFDQQGHTQIGKLKSNPTATEYTLHGGGINGKKLSVWDDDFDEKRSNMRQQIGFVEYRSKVYQRGMLVNSYAPVEVTGWVNTAPSQASDTPTAALHHFHRVEPVWDPKLNSFKLDLSDRQYKGPIITSSKNMQLALDSNDEIVLMFHKVDKDTFTLEYTWPLSGIQALGMVLSSFDERGVMSTDGRK